MSLTDYSFLNDETGQTTPQPDDLNTLVSRVLRLDEQAKDIKEQLAATKAEILENLRSAQGFADDITNKLDLEVPVDTGKVVIKFPEKWEWDADRLMDVFSGHPIPSYVNRKLSITKSNYERLSPTVKASVDPALSVEIADEPTVSVKANKEKK